MDLRPTGSRTTRDDLFMDEARRGNVLAARRCDAGLGRRMRYPRSVEVEA